MPGPIRIQVDTDARAAGRDIDQLGDKTSRVASRLKSLGKGALLGLGAGLLAGAAAGAKFAQAAIEDEQAASRMAQTFKRAAGATKSQISATEDWITAQGKALGVADDDLRPALSRLVTATGDVGKAQKLASLAMDVSAGTGKSLEQVSTALMKAQNGQVSSLSRLGINTKNAAGETISMEEATRRMGDTFGGAAQKNADTLGGRIDRLKLMASEAGETLGAKMLPYIERFAAFIVDRAIPAASDIAGRIRDWSVSMAQDLAPTVRTVSGFITGTLVPGLSRLAVFLNQNRDVLIGVAAGLATAKAAMVIYTTYTKIVAAATVAWNTVQAVLNGTMRANPVGIVVTAIALLAAGMVIAYQKSETFRSVVDRAFSVVKSAASNMWDGIKVVFKAMKDGFEAVGKAGTWLWNNALQPAFKFIVNGIASILDLWSSMLSTLGKVPGFGWAKDAADAMANAAEKARGLADGIKKIPPRKDVTVAVKYTYSGLRGPGGSGSTRGRDDDFMPSGRTAFEAGQTFGRNTASGFTTGLTSTLDYMRDKVSKSADDLGKKAVEAIRNRLDRAKELRDSVLSLRDSIAGALTGDLFGGTGDETGTALDKFRAAVSAARTTADQVLAATKALLGKGISQSFLNSLMSSGNTELIVQLAGAADAAQLAKAYEGVIATNEQSGRLVAEEVIGVRLDKVGQTIRELMQQLAQRDKEQRQRERTVSVRLTSEQRSQLERGREIRLDLDMWESAGGRQTA